MCVCARVRWPPTPFTDTASDKCILQRTVLSYGVGGMVCVCDECVQGASVVVVTIAQCAGRFQIFVFASGYIGLKQNCDEAQIDFAA